jgi:hypothetical protein
MGWLFMSSPAQAGSSEVFTDISDNNAGFDARAYASAGHLLVMIKATQGTGYLNPDWAAWTQSAHAHRLAVAHYHFCDPAADAPISEARRFWETVRPEFDARTDRLVIDLETGDENLWPQYLAYLDGELCRYSTISAVLYTMASCLTPALKVRSERFHVASWGNRQPSGGHRTLPAGTLWAWQYYGGTVDPSGGPTEFAGVGQADGNVLNPETVRELRAALGR